VKATTGDVNSKALRAIVSYELGEAWSLENINGEQFGGLRPNGVTVGEIVRRYALDFGQYTYPNRRGKVDVAKQIVRNEIHRLHKADQAFKTDTKRNGEVVWMG
jgi:hypothetical protein